MSQGANAIHKRLRMELENYIRSQYFGKSPILLNSLNDVLDDEGLLYRVPFIESSAAYKSIEKGLEKADIPKWAKEYFRKLSEEGIGVFPSPFAHQIEALETFFKGQVYSEGYFDYERDGLGPVCYDYEETVQTLMEAIRNDCKLDSVYDERSNAFYRWFDEDNCKRVYEEIRRLD